MSTRLMILGLPQDHPMYGCGIKQAIEERLAGCVPITFGSISFASTQLSQKGLAEKVPPSTSACIYGWNGNGWGR